MMFYKKTSSKREYVKISHCLNCVAALGTRSTESVSPQTVWLGGSLAVADQQQQ